MRTFYYAVVPMGQPGPQVYFVYVAVRAPAGQHVDTLRTWVASKRAEENPEDLFKGYVTHKRVRKSLISSPPGFVESDGPEVFLYAELHRGIGQPS